MRTKTMPTQTPWGASQHSTRLADGITLHETSGHGGIQLSPDRIKALPKWLKSFRSGFCPKPMWYEEDCEILLVIIAFHDDLRHKFPNPKEFYVQAARRWYAFIPENV